MVPCIGHFLDAEDDSLNKVNRNLSLLNLYFSERRLVYTQVNSQNRKEWQAGGNEEITSDNIRLKAFHILGI